ncbi:MAG: biotin/lipoyl-binding protein, partial [Clostridia bacterium]|nr:biotin/lipoyl-binding protein [Clostridia bacterium]
MKYRYKTMEEIKDSRLLFDKKLPHFGFIILTVVTLLVGFLVYWSVITPKVSVITAKGFVESKGKNYVAAPFTGEVVNMSIEEGKVVKEGDVLFSIKSSDIDLQIGQLGSQKEVYQKELELYNKYITCLNSSNNMFSSIEENEKFLYNKYEAYKSKIEQLKVDSDALRGYGYTEDQINDVIK